MPRYRTAYPPEFRRQMVDLVRSGRTPEELAREFEPTAQSISTWVKQAERDAGKRVDGPTSAEREELGRLRRENHRLRQDRAAERVVGGRHQCAAASGVRDGGRSPAIGLQERVANHRKRRWSKAGVVSVTEKALQRRQVGDRKANTREPPFKCRKHSDDVETGE